MDIKGSPRHTADQAALRAVARGARDPEIGDAFTYLYFVALYRDAAKVGINPDVLVAQWDVETSWQDAQGNWKPGTSPVWLASGNPAGLGIFDDGSTAGYTFTPDSAARMQVTHMCVYAGIDLPNGWEKSPRWDVVVAKGWADTVRTVYDLAGKWATNPRYGELLISRYNAFWQGVPEIDQPAPPTSSSPPKDKPTMATLNFDTKLVPFPPYEFNLALRKVDGVGQSNHGKRTWRADGWHRGLTGGQSLDAAVGYLNSPSVAGLADGYIDNVSGRVVVMNPMVDLFPDVLKLVPDWEDRAGWTNGPYNAGAASADAKAFVAKFGGRISANIINQDSENWEILGNYDSPISDKCKRVIAQISASRAQRAKIPWDSWPIHPVWGTTVMYGHREFCGVNYKLCPGAVVWEFMNGPLVKMVQDILRQAQVDGKVVTVDGVKPAPMPSAPPVVTPPVTTPVTPPGFSDNLHARLFGEIKGVKFDPNGVISKKWLEVGNETFHYPKIVDVIDEPANRYYVFEGGRVIWYVKDEGAVRVLGEAS